MTSLYIFIHILETPRKNGEKNVYSQQASLSSNSFPPRRQFTLRMCWKRLTNGRLGIFGISQNTVHIYVDTVSDATISFTKDLFSKAFRSDDSRLSHGQCVIFFGIRIETTLLATFVVTMWLLTKVCIPLLLGNWYPTQIAQPGSASTSHFITPVGLDKGSLTFGTCSYLGGTDCLFYLEPALILPFLTDDLIAPKRNVSLFTTFPT